MHTNKPRRGHQIGGYQTTDRSKSDANVSFSTPAQNRAVRRRYRRRGGPVASMFGIASLVLYIITSLIGHIGSSPSTNLNSQQLKQAEAALSAKTYSGNGNEVIGTIHVSSPSSIGWLCPECEKGFTITSSPVPGGPAPLHVSEPGNLALADNVTIPAGTYKDVRITSTAGPAWFITITPGTD